MLALLITLLHGITDPSSLAVVAIVIELVVEWLALSAFAEEPRT